LSINVYLSSIPIFHFDLIFLFLIFLHFYLYHALILDHIFHVEGTRTASAFIRNTSEAASVATSSVSNTATTHIPPAIINNTVSASVDTASVPTTASTSVPYTTTVSIPTAYHTATSLPNASLPATAAAALPTTAAAASLPIDTNVDGLIPVHLNPDKVFFTGGESTGEFCIHRRVPSETDIFITCRGGAR
jgi:hypothetical protein